jgi:thioredoxin
MKVLVGALFLSTGVAFSPSAAWSQRSERTWLRSTTPDIGTMKLRDIQAELKIMGVPFSDCFDKESLTSRLREARDGKYETINDGSVPAESAPVSAAANPPTTQLDSDSILEDLRTGSLKDLKIECSRRNLRYATFLEKEDFVQAIWKDMKSIATFSVSGVLRPGVASEITGVQLDQELTSDTTPILLDVYATWCGPCKMMAPELEKAAQELGSRCRVAKLDSDQHPEWASRYQVQGLPTVLLLHNGKVKGKVEGACMKDRLVELAKS